MATSQIGRDGMSVLIPDGYGWQEGSDGRVVAIPPGYGWEENPDGRIELIPPKVRIASASRSSMAVSSEWSKQLPSDSGEEGSDGRVVTYLSSSNEDENA